MRKIVLILTSIAAVAVIGFAVYLSQLGSGDRPAGNESGTTECAEHGSTAPDAGASPEAPAPDASAEAKGDEGGCVVPGDGGKPGEAPKN